MQPDIDPDLQLLAAIAHPARLAIVRQLSSDGPSVASGLNVCCDVGQSTLSHHLKVLREAGWVRSERRGPWIWFSLRVGAVDQLRRIADGVRPSSLGKPLVLAVPAPSAAVPERPSHPGSEHSWRQW